MSATRPNILLVLTDEERAPPPYEQAALAEFRRAQLPAHDRLAARSRSLRRHYVGSTACVPSRTTLFTGQYPSLHGAANTDGLAKQASDPGMHFLDPNTVPTMGDWFRAGGYQTHYRGKWHVSHADLLIPGTHERLRTNDGDGLVDPAAVAAYRGADRLDPFGFSGWVGREPHGIEKSDCGFVKDPIYAEQVVALFAELAEARDRGPWLAVASFVNPHDIAFAGRAWDLVVGHPGPDGQVPEIAPAPSQSDSFDGRPSAQREFFERWPVMLYEQATDPEYRRLYHYLIKKVDAAIVRILDALEASGMADDTIVVFTSDHGDLLGSHGGMVQKWHNAFDEALRVPMLVSGPGIDVARGDIDIATSHVDVIPTLLGLAGIDPEAAAAHLGVAHVETQTLPGRDLSALLTGAAAQDVLDAPIYFMTEDEVSRGLRSMGIVTRETFEPVGAPAKVESVIARLATGSGGADELWKLNQYYDRLVDWEEAHGIPQNPFLPAPADPEWELYNLTADPEERTNQAATGATPMSPLRDLLASERDAKRRLPSHRNPVP